MTPDERQLSHGPRNPDQGRQYYGPCGDIYVSGTYSTPLTIAAANNVIVTGNLTTRRGHRWPTRQGSATLGLVADQYVRVWHDCTGNPP